jgi:hypothetical protein
VINCDVVELWYNLVVSHSPQQILDKYWRQRLWSSSSLQQRIPDHAECIHGLKECSHVPQKCVSQIALRPSPSGGFVDALRPSLSGGFVNALRPPPLSGGFVFTSTIGEVMQLLNWFYKSSLQS